MPVIRVPSEVETVWCPEGPRKWLFHQTDFARVVIDGKEIEGNVCLTHGYFKYEDEEAS